MYKLLDDISTVTTVPKGTLDKLADKASLCLAHDVVNNLLAGEAITDFDVGIGHLYISIEDNNIRYKFIPSPGTAATMRKAVTTNTSPLVSAVETAISDRIVNTYKDLM